VLPPNKKKKAQLFLRDNARYEARRQKGQKGGKLNAGLDIIFRPRVIIKEAETQQANRPLKIKKEITRGRTIKHSINQKRQSGCFVSLGAGKGRKRLGGMGDLNMQSLGGME